MRFHAAINSRNLAALSALMSEDHRFTDSVGGTIVGRAASAEAWQAFFATFPDYRNHPREHHVRGAEVIMAGESRCSDPRLAGPALWRALVRDGLVAEWQVYNDTAANRLLLRLD